jgi:hypothetical protein
MRVLYLLAYARMICAFTGSGAGAFASYAIDAKLTVRVADEAADKTAPVLASNLTLKY